MPAVVLFLVSPTAPQAGSLTLESQHLGKDSF
jgi:hypothetical protein